MASITTLFQVLLLHGVHGQTCKTATVDFIMTEGDATLLQIEDDITKDLAKVGITVNRRVLPKDEMNEAMTSGDFHLAFSETWGPPYDPHSFAASWATHDEAYYAALQGMPAPHTYDVLMGKISDVLKAKEDERDAKWSEILHALHDAATELPFAGKRIPAVINNRLHGYKKGLQQFDYPVHTLRVASGEKTITVSPGAQTGLFVGVGRLDPHSYRPNEFFANNFVYEGLVEYGEDGTILPSLAVSWTIADRTSGGQTYTFQLREGVTFHDGSAWDCSVAKLNFDHVLAPPLTTPDWHGWYGLPLEVDGWSCASDYVFEVTTKSDYYPLLQELTYIRPLRMLSPAMFVGGAASDPLTQNSCPTGWESATLGDVVVTCVGTEGISGTGRWVYDSTEMDGDDVTAVVFNRNPTHWDSSPADAVEVMRLVRYADHAAVQAALVDGSLDVVVGEGVLDPEDVADVMKNHKDKFTVSMTEPLQNRIVIFNTARAPTDDLQLRKVIIHAIDKAAIIEKELHGLAEPVDGLFPKTAPFCHLDLTPRWDYDLEKARLLNCPEEILAEAQTARDEALQVSSDAQTARDEALQVSSDAQTARDEALQVSSDAQTALDEALADLAEVQKELEEAQAESGASTLSAGVLGLLMIFAGRF